MKTGSSTSGLLERVWHPQADALRLGARGSAAPSLAVLAAV